MKYEVEIVQKEIYYIGGIEAKSEEEAKEIALKMYEKGDKEEYHHDSDADVKIIDISHIKER